MARSGAAAIRRLTPKPTKHKSPEQKRAKKLAKLAKAMRGIDLCMLTTMGEGGALHTRPMLNNGEVDFTGVAHFFSQYDSAKVREIERDNHVALSYVGGTRKKPIWIAVSGSAKIVADEATKRALWVRELSHWLDGPNDPGVVVIEVTAERATWWSHDDESELDLR